TQIALVVLAENDEVKQHLARHGVIAESLQDIKPMAVASARALTEDYAHIGENKSLGLTGRPRRRLQSLATSQTYGINNTVYLSLSSIQSEREDYRMYDAHLMRQVITEEIAHIYKHWLSSEVAVLPCWLISTLRISPMLMSSSLRCRSCSCAASMTTLDTLQRTLPIEPPALTI